MVAAYIVATCRPPTFILATELKTKAQKDELLLYWTRLLADYERLAATHLFYRTRLCWLCRAGSFVLLRKRFANPTANSPVSRNSMPIRPRYVLRRFLH